MLAVVLGRRRLHARRVARAGDVAGVMVAKLDRLSRSLAEFAGLLEDARGLRCRGARLGVDLSTPAGQFLTNVMASAAQWERRIIGQRTQTALAEKRAQRIRIGRPPTMDAKMARRVRTKPTVARAFRRSATA
jgi:DNA invertase Pin-like site-specific DNA recombinase